MKRLSTCFVALARSAKHEALLYHLLGDREQEAHCEELVRGYMHSARTSKSNERI
jgi:hypothetical protein